MQLDLDYQRNSEVLMKHLMTIAAATAICAAHLGTTTNEVFAEKAATTVLDQEVK